MFSVKARVIPLLGYLRARIRVEANLDSKKLSLEFVVSKPFPLESLKKFQN